MTRVTRIFFGTRVTRILFWNADDAGDADFILERGWTRVTRIFLERG
jgi:hypothetical protein